MAGERERADTALSAVRNGHRREVDALQAALAALRGELDEARRAHGTAIEQLRQEHTAELRRPAPRRPHPTSRRSAGADPDGQPRSSARC